MREISSSITFEIRAGETVPMMVTHSTSLTPQGGAVWVTRSDDFEDYWLAPGHTLYLRRGERLWLSVEGAAEAQVSFALPVRAEQKALHGFSRQGERLAAWFRGGWRAV
ncbi:DUF2917 domain-containing protein [Paraburkholderia bonniea]|uniref:DUF2917 domain-containing protein n=1 Tax=Paraburkholderia bonniea TaxID=2152891 RepID=UPI0012917751|nr:DUF2917 domain-containing protein [Paraburkholderia bonniea]WJF90061.1 DUF2917 domain-containing protein [Paraburkholderia bonniea]WJF93375.1 DUF2917 domain-containing protein [Paraburkholderia bonniea]